MRAIDFYQQTLPVLEQFFGQLERLIDPPRLVNLGYGEEFRFEGQSLEQALIQKLARLISGLHACVALLERGLVQELAALQRMNDEFREDILFLSQPLLGGERTDLHDRYLEDFNQEEVDANGNLLESTQRRRQIPRRKIQAANARAIAAIQNPSDNQEIHRTLAKTFGGFVHGASPQIMEMYGGLPPRFHVSGMLDSPRFAEHSYDLWNYFYRGINSLGLVANALGSHDLGQRALELRREFEHASEREF